mgnify:CR=1 FL=1
MNMRILFEGIECPVIDWREAVVAFTFNGGTLWRCHAAVSVISADAQPPSVPLKLIPLSLNCVFLGGTI